MSWSVRAFAALAALAWAGPGCGAAVSVRSTAELNAAIAAAKPGDTIRLAPGRYGAISIVDRRFAAPVTLEGPAALAGLTVVRSANLRFTKLDLGRPLQPGEKEWTRLTDIADSADIAFDGVRFHGSLDGNPGNDGWGMAAAKTRNLSVTGSEFTELGRGMNVSQIDGLTVAGNRFHLLRSDGVNVAGSSRVRIVGNRFSDFFPAPGDHPDAIQFWNRDQPRGSSDIVIRDNVVLQGRGVGPQGIFMGDGQQHGYANVLIENNLVYSADQFHGIMVSDAQGLVIRGNTLVSPRNDDKRMWIMLADVTDARLERNVAEDYLIERSKVVQSGNVRADRLNGRARDARAAATPDTLTLPGAGYQIPGR